MLWSAGAIQSGGYQQSSSARHRKAKYVLQTLRRGEMKRLSKPTTAIWRDEREWAEVKIAQNGINQPPSQIEARNRARDRLPSHKVCGQLHLQAATNLRQTSKHCIAVGSFQDSTRLLTPVPLSFFIAANTNLQTDR